jgi:hypothetical protein
MIRIKRVIRRMRGGSQSWLMQGEDQGFYVVKAANNPQHRRTLVNDWIGSKLLRAIGVNAADCTLIHVPDHLIEAHNVHMQIGARQLWFDSGPHFGSLCPVNPERKAIFDFLPSKLFPKISNLDDFFSTFIFDRWTANRDSRQAVFYRESALPSFRALMIDQGFIFQGALWNFVEFAKPDEFYREAYILGASRENFEITTQAIFKVSETTVQDIIRQIPFEWLQNDDAELARVIEQLFRRKYQLPALIDRSIAQWSQCDLQRAPEKMQWRFASHPIARMSQSPPATFALCLST